MKTLCASVALLAALVGAAPALADSSNPNPITFGARHRAGGVELNWRTVSQVGVLGFEVWRSSGNGAVKVRTVLVSSNRPSGVRGSSYRLVDRNTHTGVRYTYRLRVIERNGARRWASIARVSL